MSNYNTYEYTNLENGNTFNGKLLSVKVTNLEDFTASVNHDFDSTYFLLCTTNSTKSVSNKYSFSSLQSYISQSIADVDSFDGHFRGVFEHSGSEGDSLCGSFSGSLYGDMTGSFFGNADLNGKFTGDHSGSFYGYHSGSAKLTGSFKGIIDTSSYALSASYCDIVTVDTASYADESGISDFSEVSRIATSSLKLVSAPNVPLRVGSNNKPVYFYDGIPYTCSHYLQGITSSYAITSSYSYLAETSSYSAYSEEADIANTSSYSEMARTSSYSELAEGAHRIINDDNFTVGSSLYIKLTNSNEYNVCNLRLGFDETYFSYVDFICPSSGYYSLTYEFILLQTGTSDIGESIFPDILKRVGDNSYASVVNNESHVFNVYLNFGTESTAPLSDKHTCKIDAVKLEKDSEYRFEVKFNAYPSSNHFGAYGLSCKIASYYTGIGTAMGASALLLTDRERNDFSPTLELRKIGEIDIYERFISGYTGSLST